MSAARVETPSSEDLVPGVDDGEPILVLGGYGYGNVGDEAQLAGSLELLRQVAPDTAIKVLSPDPGYTREHFGDVDVGEAPRLAIYDADHSAMYWLDSRLAHLRFLLRSAGILMNAVLVNRGLPTVLLRRRRTAFLDQVRSSRLLFFSGGGYMTGSTRSRLWEAMLVLRIARMFGVPTVLSGQTIGIWGGWLDRRIARWGLAHVRLIATRDATSEAAARELGIEGPQIVTTCDDALFSPTADDGAAIRAVAGSGVDLSGGERWSVLHFMDWGIETAGERTVLLQRIDGLVLTAAAELDGPLLLCPMVPSDAAFLEEVQRRHPDRLRILDHGYDHRVVRRVMGMARVVISMRHHPLVFALGEGTPAIALTRGDYYRHKNLGTLRVLGAGQWNIDLEAEEAGDRLRKLLGRLPEQGLPPEIRQAVTAARQRRAHFAMAAAEELTRVEGRAP